MSLYDAVDHELKKAVLATYTKANNDARAGNEPAAALYCKAAEVLEQVDALLQQAKALSMWADQQAVGGPFPNMTALNQADGGNTTIVPVLYADYETGKTGAAWKVINSPLQDSGKDAWTFTIDEEAKAKGVLTVQAVVYTKSKEYGPVYDQVPVLEKVEVAADDPRLTWGPIHWVEFIKPIAEAYVASSRYKPGSVAQEARA